MAAHIYKERRISVRFLCVDKSCRSYIATKGCIFRRFLIRITRGRLVWFGSTSSQIKEQATAYNRKRFINEFSKFSSSSETSFRPTYQNSLRNFFSKKFRIMSWCNFSRLTHFRQGYFDKDSQGYTCQIIRGNVLIY